MKKIYVLEDDEGIRDLIEFLLISRGYVTKTFPNISEFLTAIQADLPDLFLLDVMVPDGNGLDLCFDLKNYKPTVNIPVILMSAHQRKQVMEKADDFLEKPFDVDDLLWSVNQQLN